MEISKQTIEELKLEGLSFAGTGTSIRLVDFGICFDVAQGLPFSYPSEIFLITHGHMDHAGGVPYIVSQRALNSIKPGWFVMPAALEPPLTQVLELWSKIEGFKYEYKFEGQSVGDTIEFKPNIQIEAFKTVHRVASQGYLIKQRKKKLKKQFDGLHPEQIVEHRRQGEDVEDIYWEPLFAFTGDTQIEFLDHSPQAASAKVLMMEVTYYDSKKPISAAREWGHIHLDELIPRLDEISSSKIVLIHSSRRHTRREINEILATKIPPIHRDRVVLF